MNNDYDRGYEAGLEAAREERQAKVDSLQRQLDGALECWKVDMQIAHAAEAKLRAISDEISDPRKIGYGIIRAIINPPAAVPEETPPEPCCGRCELDQCRTALALDELTRLSEDLPLVLPVYVEEPDRPPFGFGCVS